MPEAYQINVPSGPAAAVLYEASPLYCRVTGVLLAGSGSARVVAGGEVLGVVTATGKWKGLATSGTAGDQNAAGIALHPATAPNGTDDQVVVLERGPAVVRESELVWPAAADANARAAARTALLAKGIRVLMDGPSPTPLP